jgi:hypothetical protein
MKNYVDVFVSHKQEDTDEAKRLKSRIEQLQYTCYIDADDTGVKQLASAATAEHLRNTIRGCRCLLYVMSERSHESKWMPWELGFFDGRWGRLPVGLYLLPSRKSSRVGATPSDGSAVFSVQEYLEMYECVDDESLPEFLRRSVSTTMLLNRADVDVDRFMTLMSGALRDPADFWFGCLQYATGVVRELWTSYYGTDSSAIFEPWQQWLGSMRRLGSKNLNATQPGIGAIVQHQILGRVRKLHERGAAGSEG